MMKMSKLQNWYCDDGSGQVMRRSSSFKATEDIDPYLNLGHHFFVILVILVIENSSKSRGRKKLETLELDSNLKTICHLLDNYPFPPSHQSFRWKSGKVKKENKIKEIQA